MIVSNKIPSSHLAGVEEKIVRGLYLGLLDREPDLKGMEDWVKRIRSGESIDDITKEILRSAEYHLVVEPIKRKKNSLTESVSNWAKKSLQDDPLIIVETCIQNLAYEKSFVHPMHRWQIPFRIMGFENFEWINYSQHQEKWQGFSKTKMIRNGEKHPLYLNEPDKSSSSLPFNTKILERFTELKNYSTLKVESVFTNTLDSAIPELDHVDLLKINIPGLELSFLKSAVNVLKRTEVIHCDVSFLEVYQGQAFFSEIEQFLRSQGFELVDIFTRKYYAFDKTSFSFSKDILGRAEAIFFRSQTENTSIRSIISQAILALILYRKPSLAAWLSDHIGEDEHPFASLFKN